MPKTLPPSDCGTNLTPSAALALLAGVDPHDSDSESEDRHFARFTMGWTEKPIRLAMYLGPNSILIVDDSDDDRFLTEHMLESAGFSSPFHLVATGPEAIALLESDLAAGFRLVLLDIRMPMMDGFEVLSWIRSRPSLAHIKVVMHSTSDVAEDITRARSLGADGYIQKDACASKLTTILASIDPRLVPAKSVHRMDARK